MSVARTHAPAAGDDDAGAIGVAAVVGALCKGRAVARVEDGFVEPHPAAVAATRTAASESRAPRTIEGKLTRTDPAALIDRVTIPPIGGCHGAVDRFTEATPRPAD
jgi:hypothetical protein